MVTCCKLVPANNFVRQSIYRRSMGKLCVGDPGRNVSCLHDHGDPTSESELDGSHPVPGRAESMTTVILMGGCEKQPQLLKGLVTLKVGRGWEESKRQMRGEPIGELGSSWDLPGLGRPLPHGAGGSGMGGGQQVGTIVEAAALAARWSQQ